MDNPSLVVDASVTLAWAFEDESSAYSDLVLDSLAEISTCVPNIWPLEVGNALLVAERRGRLKQAATVEFLALLRQLPIKVETERLDRLLGEILALAREQGLSTYDASYLHLAMRRGLPLATTDEYMRQAAARAGIALFGK